MEECNFSIREFFKNQISASNIFPILKQKTLKIIYFGFFILNHILIFHLFLVFPDYVGFIKKIMKLMQKGYDEIQSLEIELRILEETAEPPSRPRKYLFL